MNTILDYISIDIKTMFENNIKQHYVDFVERFVNVWWKKKQTLLDIKENKILCIIVGDNVPDNNFNILFTCVLEAFNTYNIGVYAPYDRRSCYKEKYEQVGERIFNVPNTDCGFWFIHPSIIPKLKYLNYSVSKYGWGIDVITIKEARKNGLLVLRDYRCETDQLDHSTNYNCDEARNQMHQLEEEYRNLQ
jgi:hypothetical protein